MHERIYLLRRKYCECNVIYCIIGDISLVGYDLPGVQLFCVTKNVSWEIVNSYVVKP